MAKRFECQSTDCEFAVESDDENEIVDIVRGHVRERHSKDVPQNHIKSRIEEI